MASNESNINQYVKLNVGGCLFQTTIGTLMSEEGMLKNMFKGDFGNRKDSDGFVVIDRNGDVFSDILDFLRKGSICLSRPRKELEDILDEAEFYQIESLITTIKERLNRLRESALELDGIPKIYASCEKDSHLKFLGASKPVLHLVLGNYSGKLSAACEAANFRDLYEKYKDEFLFSLELRSSSDTYWVYYYGGKEVKLDSQERRPTEKNPFIDIFASYLRNP